MTQTGEQPPRWYADHEPEAAAVIRRQIDELRAQRDAAEPGERVALQMRIYSLTQLWWRAMRGAPTNDVEMDATKV